MRVVEETLAGNFWLDPQSSKMTERENVNEGILSLGPDSFSVEIDLMTPIDPNTSPKV